MKLATGVVLRGILMAPHHPTGPVCPLCGYSSYETARQSQVAGCLVDAEGHDAVHGANAAEAQRRAQLRSQRALPPIALSTAPASR